MYSSFHSDSLSDEFIRNHIFTDYQYKGLVIEVGGGSPDTISFSKHWRNNGWRSIVFEPNPNYYNEFLKQDLECYNLACSDKDDQDVDFSIVNCNNELSYTSLGIRYDCFDAEKFVVDKIKVNTIRLKTFLKQNKIDKIDILSIDVEGWELEVMKGFDPTTVDCQIIILENFQHDPSYTVFMENIGYKLVIENKHDYIYEKIK